jgi:hypothetical protein
VDVARWEKVLARVLSGQVDASLPFDDLWGLLKRLGSMQDINGDHHIFRKPGQPEIINLQPLPTGEGVPGTAGAQAPAQVWADTLQLRRGNARV